MRYLAVLVLSFPLLARRAPGGPPAGAPEEGIPVTDPLVISKCSGCHHKDDKGNLSRLSWVRTTPEGWEEAIKRMVRLNGLRLTPEEARAIVKSLSATHGLAPEEAKPVMYIAEHRMIDETITDETVRGACAVCHAIGRAAVVEAIEGGLEAAGRDAQRIFPRRGFPGAFTASSHPMQPERSRRPPGQDRRQPVDAAIDYFAKDFGLHTPEWAAWRARMRSPKLSGRWIVSGYQLGRGKVIGEMVVEPGSNEDEFTTSVKLTYLKDGSSVTRTGRVDRVHGLFLARAVAGARRRREPAPGNAGGNPRELREVMWISPDQSAWKAAGSGARIRNSVTT